MPAPDLPVACPAPRTGRTPRTARALPLSAWALLLACSAGCRTPAASAPRAEEPATAPRPLSLLAGGRWIGNGVAYGPYRDGQRPGGPSPSAEELREDLRLMAPRWSLLRTYGSDEPAERLLQVIREDRLPVKLLLGAWIAAESAPAAGGAAPLPEARAANRRQVEAAIRLANAYPEVVLAVVVGNETQVSWSDHRVDPEVLVGHVREVRARTAVPVATADDFGFWVTPESERLAREVDLLVNHVHAMWNGEPLERALAFTQAKHAAVAARHPGRTVLLGEAGWATRRHGEGEQAKLIKGEAGEAQQQVFFEQLTAWTARERIPSTWFEAFDERWKGGPHPDDVEKHWGLFRADRTPKQAVQAAPR